MAQEIVVITNLPTEKFEKKEDIIVLIFKNPVTNKQDSIAALKKDLEYIKRDNKNLYNVSFFQEFQGNTFIVNLYIDNYNTVRSVSKSFFFLRANEKIFR